MADTDQIINVMIIVDAESIINDLGTNTDPAKPAQVTQANRIFMVTKQNDIVSGQAGNELNLKAETDDIVRWHATSLSLNSSLDVILYKFVLADGTDLISPPVPLLTDVTVPLPNMDDPIHPTTQTIKNYYWQTTVLSAGKVTYHFQFIILDRTGAVQGYYWWDPFITISD